MTKNSLDMLEEKTRQAVEALESLRRDNERLVQELRDRGDEGGGAAAPLDEEIQLLRQERDAVRERVEGLIHLLEASL